MKESATSAFFHEDAILTMPVEETQFHPVAVENEAALGHVDQAIQIELSGLLVVIGHAHRQDAENEEEDRPRHAAQDSQSPAPPGQALPPLRQCSLAAAQPKPGGREVMCNLHDGFPVSQVNREYHGFAGVRA